MHCPNCGVPHEEIAHDCPGCGLIFAKWRQRHTPTPPDTADSGSGGVTDPGLPHASPASDKPGAEPFFPGWAAVKKPRTPEEKFLRWMIFFASMGFFVFLIGLFVWLSARGTP